MSIQTINIGNRVNDGLGDDLRTAFEKVNANFTELSNSLTVTVTAASSTGVNLFKEQQGSNLIFKTLESGTKISIVETTNSVIINNTTNDAFERFDTDSGSITAGVGNNRQITLEGAVAPGSVTGRTDIEVTAIGPRVLFRNLVPVVDILTIYDFGPINGEFTNSVQLLSAFANIDFGTIGLPGTVDLDVGGIF